MWSRVPETTLSPSYPERVNFSPISLTSSTNRLYEDLELFSVGRDNSGGGGQGGGGKCLVSAG